MADIKKFEDIRDISIFEAFEIKCHKCGSSKISLQDDRRKVDDGDGRIDEWGSVSLECLKCGNWADIIF